MRRPPSGSRLISVDLSPSQRWCKSQKCRIPDTQSTDTQSNTFRALFHKTKKHWRMWTRMPLYTSVAVGAVLVCCLEGVCEREREREKEKSFVCVSVCERVCVCAWVCMCAMRAFTNRCTCVGVGVSVHVCMRACVHACMCMCIQDRVLITSRSLSLCHLMSQTRTEESRPPVHRTSSVGCRAHADTALRCPW